MCTWLQFHDFCVGSFRDGFERLPHVQGCADLEVVLILLMERDEDEGNWTSVSGGKLVGVQRRNNRADLPLHPTFHPPLPNHLTRSIVLRGTYVLNTSAAPGFLGRLVFFRSV